ncbi:hypothetical protein M0R45_020304 [Rubus argutus]|uniref:Disease resistance R13L4/SHOC-2-like LRR domain-containing protein n=1 Tax=Rubus argutus TaxID=59490 RepID=A0AAW1X8H6_RUBAR
MVKIEEASSSTSSSSSFTHPWKYHGNVDKVQKWKKALSEAANLSGWPLLDEIHSESKLICEIVEEISKQIIERTYLEVAKYPVGIEPRVQYVKNTGTSKIIGIKVELPKDSDVMCLSGTTFSEMRNLRLFIHRSGCFSGVLNYLPNNLRVVDWPNFPFQSLPSNFNPKKLALLHMPGSYITRFGEGFKLLINLTSIDLSDCKYLTKVSDLSGIPNVQTLDLQNCKNLVEVHHSVGFLDKLESFILNGCSSLTIFPTTGCWKSLKYLWLQNCIMLESFIEIVIKIQSIEELFLRGSGIKELPSGIGHLMTSLRELSLFDSPIKELPSSIGYITSLRGLDVSESLIKELPSSIGYLTFLRELNVSRTLIEELPSSIGSLIGLECLIVERCEYLRNVPHSIYGGLQHLTHLNLSWCPKLVTFPNRPVSSLVSSSVESLSPTLMLPTTSYVSHDNCGSQLFPTLEWLSFQGCNLSSVFDFLSNLDCESTLKHIDLSHSSFDSLPASISKFHKLDYINLSSCKWLRDISELPPNISVIWMVDCVSLEVFLTLSNILEQKDAPVIKWMDLSNCHRLVDNLGIDVVSKMAKALLNQAVGSKKIKDNGLTWPFMWKAIVACLAGSEVPKWFHCRKVNVYGLPDPNDDTIVMYELLIKIPRSLKWGDIGLVVCVILEITQALSDACGFSVEVMVDEIKMPTRRNCVFHPKSSGHHVFLEYFGLDILWERWLLKDKMRDESLPCIFRVCTYMESGKPLLLKSCGLHLANMPAGNDDDDEHVLGNDDDDVAEEVEQEEEEEEEEEEEKEEEEEGDDDDDARGEDWVKQTNIGRATLAFLRCFGITCM